MEKEAIWPFHAVVHAWQHRAASSWELGWKGDAPVGLGVAMGMGCDVLRGARLAVGKCSGADGVSWLVCICPGTTGGFKARGRILWE